MNFKLAYLDPYRRIYLIWGVILLIGFGISQLGLFDGYIHWYLLTLFGLFFQFYRQSLRLPRAKELIIFWALVSFLGTLYIGLCLRGILPYPTFIHSWGYFFLLLMSPIQILTGVWSHDRFATIIGVIWAIVAILLWPNTILPEYSLILTGLLTGLPYIYIAIRK
jgi:hypothetical protein